MARDSKAAAPKADREEPSFASKVSGTLLFCLFAYGAGALIFSGSESTPDANAATGCGTRAACIIEEHKVAAEVRCEPEIENMGNYTSRWTNSWYESRFSHYAVDLEDENTLTMFGDRIEFQNAFGAWQRASYVCVYDYSREMVLTVSGQPGRLDL